MRIVNNFGFPVVSVNFENKMATCGLSHEVGLSSLGRIVLVGTSVGFGIGIGIGAGLLVARKFKKHCAENEKLVVCVHELAQEMKQLRSVIVRLEGNIASSKETRSTRNESSANSSKGYMSPRTLSDDDMDEYYELARVDTEVITPQFVTERLQTTILPDDDDVKSVIQEVERLNDDDNSEKNIDKVHNLLNNAVKQNPNNAELMWRLGKSFFDVASEKGKQGYLEEKKNLLYKGLAVVQKSVEIDPQNSRSQKWCALLLGSTADYETTQDRILLGFKYKNHISKAIELNNRDASSYHLLGRWCYEVSQLPWWQRRAAAAFIAEPPTSTIKEALENFIQAEHLDPGFWLTNSYWIAKCYYEQSQYGECKKWLQKVIAMKPTSEDDEKSLQSAKELLQTL